MHRFVVKVTYFSFVYSKHTELPQEPNPKRHLQRAIVEIEASENAYCLDDIFM